MNNIVINLVHRFGYGKIIAVAVLLVCIGCTDFEMLERHLVRELFLNAYYGRAKEVKAILRLGVNPDSRGKRNSSALQQAIPNNQGAMVSPRRVAELISQMAVSGGGTTLHTAAASGHAEVASLLLDYGASATCYGDSGLSPLHLACRFGKFDVVAVMLERGADPNFKSRDGITPLYYATQSSNFTGEDNSRLVELLLYHGADPNLESVYSITPLHIAAEGSNTRLIAVLLKFGANPLIKDTLNNCSALDYAQDKGNQEVISLLQRASEGNK